MGCRSEESEPVSASRVENSSGSSARHRIRELDGLRGIAILSVVIWHYYYFFPAVDHRGSTFFSQIYVHFERSIALGWSGVDLFFVLSGFLIGGILLDAHESPSYFKTFYLRRFFRIIPIYYIWTVLYIFILLLMIAFLGQITRVGEPNSRMEVLAHFAFVQNLGMIHYSGLGGAWFVSTWSLAVEEQFYLVAPWIIRNVTQKALSRVVVVVMLVAPFLRMLVHYHFPPTVSLDPAYILMPCRADSLAMGVLVALLWRQSKAKDWLISNGRVLALVALLLLTGVALLTFFSPSHHSLLTQSIGFTWLAMFYGSVLLLVLIYQNGNVVSTLRTALLTEFGRISYCVYLIHQAINYICHSVVRASGNSADWKTFAAPTLSLLVTYLVARLSWNFLEQPMLNIGLRYRY